VLLRGSRKIAVVSVEIPMTKLIYLDSSDFSDLSAPILTEENQKILKALRQYKAAGAVQYSLSAIHLSEAVHASASFKSAASQRASLMTELCASRTLRFPNEIFSMEVQQALSSGDGRLAPSAVFSPDDEWFGFSLRKDMNEFRERMNREIDRRISHLNRHDRRKFKSDMNFGKASGRRRWRTLIGDTPIQALTEFPFNLLDQNFVIGWMFKEHSDQEFIKRLTGMLSNPEAMIGQILDATNQRARIYDALRQQGEDIRAALERSLNNAFTRLKSIMTADNSEEIQRIMIAGVPKGQIYRGVAEAYCAHFPKHLDEKRTTELVKSCPALSVFANAFVNYAHLLLRSNIQRFKRGDFSAVAGKASDFGDLMHAAYAPYVDLFRCDTRFASVLKEDKNVRSKIIERRALLFDHPTFSERRVG
jgi:hypothetical protein